jgi:5-methyltetrahydrofolate--homocysteine methyltransferase
MVEDIFIKLKEAVIEGSIAKTLEFTKDATKKGIPIKDILQNGLIPGIRTVGDLFEKGEYFLPELMVSGKAMLSVLEYLNPMFVKGEISSTGKFLIGTVSGDIHDIGKNIVIMMLKSSGWKVTDLGVNVNPKQFCAAVKDGEFDILGLSCLLTMTMPSAALTIKSLTDAGLRNKVKIIIGGAPVTQGYADQIGADGYGRDAWDAVIKAETLLSRILQNRGNL